MPETTTPIHFADAIPRNRNMAGHFAAEAVARRHAYDRGIINATRSDLQALKDEHLRPAHTAFAAAAAIKGRGPRWIEETLQSSDAVWKWCWDLLTDAGMTPDQIGRLTWTTAR